MNLRKFLSVSSLILISISFQLFSDTLIAAPARERNFESVRSLGRGKTFVAATDSDEAVMLNPATLAENHGLKFQIRWLQLDGLWGENTQDTINDIMTLKPGSTSPVGILQDFSSKFGKQQYLRFQASFGIRILNFDIAPFFKTSNWLDMRIPTTPEIDLHSDTMGGANISFAFPLGKSFFIGTTVRPFFRNLFTTDLTFAEIMEFEPLGDKKAADIFKNRNGTGVGFDLGLIYYLTKQTRVGMTLEDIGFTNYALSSNDDTPPVIPTFASIGMLSRIDYKPWHLDWSLDFQDLLNPEGIHASRMMHAGLELGRSYRSRDHDMGVTFGLNEGYFTFGTFIDIYLARLDIISYGVELGEVPGQRQDRRLGATLKSSLNF